MKQSNRCWTFFTQLTEAGILPSRHLLWTKCMCSFCVCFTCVVVAPRNLCGSTATMEMWNKTQADRSRSHFGKCQCNFFKIVWYPERGEMLANPQGFCLFVCKIGFSFLFNRPPTITTKPNELPTPKRQKPNQTKPTTNQKTPILWKVLNLTSLDCHQTS